SGAFACYANTSSGSTHNTFRLGARIAAGWRRSGINGTAKEIGMTIAATPAHGRIREVVVYFLRLGLLGFGGPVALARKLRHAPQFGGAQRARAGLLARRLVHCPASVRDRGERRGRVCQQVLHRFPDDAKIFDLWSTLEHVVA